MMLAVLSGHTRPRPDRVYVGMTTLSFKSLEIRPMQQGERNQRPNMRIIERLTSDY